MNFVALCDCVRPTPITNWLGLIRTKSQTTASTLSFQRFKYQSHEVFEASKYRYGFCGHNHPIQVGLLQESTASGSRLCYQTYRSDSLRCRCRGHCRYVALGSISRYSDNTSLPHPRQREETRCRPQEHPSNFAGCHRLGCARHRGCKNGSCHLPHSIHLPRNRHKVSHTQQEECRHDKLCVACDDGAGERSQRGRHHSYE